MATDMGVTSTTASPQMAMVKKVIREKARLAYRIEKYFGSKQVIHSGSAPPIASSDSQTSHRCPQPITDVRPIDVKGFKKCQFQQHVAGTIHSGLDIPGEAFNCIEFLRP